jgi:hypothetical protein
LSPLTDDGVQVKARLVRALKARGQRQFSVFRSFDFDDGLNLLFDATTPSAAQSW